MLTSTEFNAVRLFSLPLPRWKDINSSSLAMVIQSADLTGYFINVEFNNTVEITGSNVTWKHAKLYFMKY